MDTLPLDRQSTVEALGLVIDEGNLISGPFIPDGTVRIYDPETVSVWGEGDSLKEALEATWDRIQGDRRAWCEHTPG